MMQNKTADKLAQHHSTEWRGLPVVIEWPKGSVRVGERNGKPFKTDMKADYGYIPQTEAAGDEERLDVYIGTDEAAEYVYAIQQLDDRGEFDETKLMLGFPSLEDAEEMYLAHNDEGWEEAHLGDIEEIPFEELEEQVGRHQEEVAEKTASDENALVKAFIKNYEHEVDFYQEVAELAHEKLESALQDAGIKAVVSSRAKRPGRLQKKVVKRFPNKEYRTFRDIADDIVDLAGVRVALYMPANREATARIIQKVFNEIRPTKHFPKDRGPGDTLGYVADHYLVKLRPENLHKKELRFADTQVEVQVASVLMHAWAEVTHDLVYKPEKGKLTDHELKLLKDLNDLVQMGEAQLEKLQGAIEGRTSENLRFEVVAAALQRLAQVSGLTVDEFKLQAGKVAGLVPAKRKTGPWAAYIRSRLAADKAAKS
jgi:ppGpp synthetase/RelA/SpoT-type nucleotidyltranferase